MGVKVGPTRGLKFCGFAVHHKSMARPRKEINEEGREQVAKWASAGATKQEIASRLGISDDTLQLRIKEDPMLQTLFDQGHAELKLSLRSKQVELALAGNVTMLVWLGKQLLGQRDKQELAGADSAPLIPHQVKLVIVPMPKAPLEGL